MAKQTGMGGTVASLFDHDSAPLGKWQSVGYSPTAQASGGTAPAGPFGGDPFPRSGVPAEGSGY